MGTLVTSSTNVNMATMSPRGSHVNENPENDIEFVSNISIHASYLVDECSRPGDKLNIIPF
jgi:hypothetical protein